MQDTPSRTCKAPFVDKRTECLGHEVHLHLSSFPCQPGVPTGGASPPPGGIVSSWAHFSLASKAPRKGLPWRDRPSSGDLIVWASPSPVEVAPPAQSLHICVAVTLSSPLKTVQSSFVTLQRWTSRVSQTPPPCGSSCVGNAGCSFFCNPGPPPPLELTL